MYPQRSLTGALLALGLARESGDPFPLYVLLSLAARSALRIGEPELADASSPRWESSKTPRGRHTAAIGGLKQKPSSRPLGVKAAPWQACLFGTKSWNSCKLRAIALTVLAAI